MSARPGSPQSTTDEYLAAILAELRILNAQLGQAPAHTEIDDSVVSQIVGSEKVKAYIEEMLHPGRGAVL